jgi:high-affinity iron transporter
MVTQIFSVPVFLVVFRETLEAGVVLSVLLAFLKQTLGGPNGNDRVHKSLVKQVCFHRETAFSSNFPLRYLS